MLMFVETERKIKNTKFILFSSEYEGTGSVDLIAMCEAPRVWMWALTDSLVYNSWAQPLNEVSHSHSWES